MATQNINGSEDPFYRYKMPRLLAKVEGNGNGIKTVIPNLVDIAKALSRHPTLPNKYFGFELGAQTREKNEKYIVNGEHTAGRLNELLMKFIKDFVLCGKCKNPETDLIILKDQTVVRNCKACGATTSVNQNHKLVNHILKTPGAAGKEKKEKEDKESKKDKDGKKKSKDESGKKKDKKKKSKEEADDSEDSNPELTKKIEAEAGPLNRSNSKTNDNDEEDDDENWTVDTTEHAVAERRRELADLEEKLQQKMSMGEDGGKGGESDEDDSMNELVQFITSVASGTGPIEHNAVLAHAGTVRKDKIALAIIDFAFDENYAKQIPRWKRTFDALIKSGKGKTQRAILGGIERLVGVRKPALLPKVSNVLKAFYDVDLFGDEDVLAWAERASKKYVPKDVSGEVKKKADPFVTWIKTAEEESESEDEDEDDDENSADADNDDEDEEATPATSNGKTSPSKPANDEDFDIDAI